VDFNITDQLLITLFSIHPILEKSWEYSDTIHQLFIDLKKAYDSVRREVLCSILIGFGIPLKLVRLVEMCSKETCNKVRLGEHLSIRFLFQMV
jgi:hypothetical protein